jgi:hypothetical protein
VDSRRLAPAWPAAGLGVWQNEIVI